jgi:3-(3-hydroxy-phenyl)propionate hydroxylase
MTDADYDVVISGYGPTGLAAASLLARRGHRVCVFERWPSLYGLPRIATIDGESARIIQAAADVDAAFHNSEPRRRYLLANEAGEILVDYDWDTPNASGFPNRISLHQPDIEDAMDAAARARGAEINQGWEVLSVAQDDAVATVTARERIASAGGDVQWSRERRVTARYVIGADGARSAVRESLGIARESWPFRAAWLTYDATRRRTLPNFWNLSPDGRLAVIFCAPAGRAHSIIPLGREHLRFNFQVDPDRPPADALTQAAAYRHLKAVYGVTEDDVAVYRHAIYPFEGKLAESWRVGRVFLAGDAAHLMTPFLGQGGCSAFRDAINLAWKLDLVLRGAAGDALLDSYELERKPHVRTYIDGSDRLAQMVFLDDPEAAAARDRRYRAGPAPTPPPEPTLTTGVLHRNAEGAIEPPVGTMGPQGRVTVDTRTGRFDDIVGWGFQLLFRDTDPAAHLSAEQREFFQRIGGVTAGIVPPNGDTASGRATLALDIDGAYDTYFRAHDVAGLLLRPDFTVFGAVGTPADLSALIEELRTHL